MVVGERGHSGESAREIEKPRVLCLAGCALQQYFGGEKLNRYGSVRKYKERLRISMYLERSLHYRTEW